MEAVSHHHSPLNLSLNHRRPFLSAVRSLKPLSTPTRRRFTLTASSSSSSSSNPKPNPRPKPSLLIQTTCTALAATAFFLSRFHRGSPAIAAPIIETQTETIRTDDTRTRTVSGETEELRSQMELKIKANKLDEAVQILDKLIEMEPEETEWPLLKANLHSYMGNHDLATMEFEQILKTDPMKVEAYHGLVMATSESDSPEKLESVMRRVEAAMKACTDKSEVRDFKLLIAQVMVMSSEYDSALKVYQELVKEEPRDFRPHLCQGIIYTLLSNQSEAEKHFETFRRLVPKNHPYREYFDDNMFATKLFSQSRKQASS